MTKRDCHTLALVGTESIRSIMDPQLAAIMSQNLKKQAKKQGDEIVHETSGDLQQGDKPKKKYKPPPGGKLLMTW